MVPRGQCANGGWCEYYSIKVEHEKKLNELKDG
jgi:hypothetical protein